MYHVNVGWYISLVVEAYHMILSSILLLTYLLLQHHGASPRWQILQVFFCRISGFKTLVGLSKGSSLMLPGQTLMSPIAQ